MTDEQKVLLSHRRGANGVLAKVVVDLQPAVVHVAGQRLPPAQRVIHGLAEQALGQHAAAHHFQRPTEAFQNGLALPRTNQRGELRLPLNPLRSNSSSSRSCCARERFTRPTASGFNTTASPAAFIDVIPLCYDIYELREQWCYG